MRAENMKLKLFGTAWSTHRSQNQVIYQGSFIWSLERAPLKKKTPGSQPEPCSTSESSPARSTRIILISQQRSLRLSTLYHQWPDQLPSLAPKESEVDPLTALTNKIKRAEVDFYRVFGLFSMLWVPTLLATSTWPRTWLLSFKIQALVDNLTKRRKTKGESRTKLLNFKLIFLRLIHKASVFLLSCSLG